MKATIIKTSAVIDKPDYLLNGYVITFDPSKWNGNTLISIYNEHYSTERSVNTLRSYGGKLLYRDDNEIAEDDSYVLDGVTVYVYYRLAYDTGSSTRVVTTFKVSQTVTRMDIMNKWIDDMSIAITGRQDPSKPSAYGHIYFKTDSLLMNKTFIHRVDFNYCDIEVNIDHFANEENLEYVSLSGNNCATGNIMSLTKSASTLVGIFGAATDLYGQLEDLFDAIANTGRTGTINISLAGSRVTYEGRRLTASGSVTFSDGEWVYNSN